MKWKILGFSVLLIGCYSSLFASESKTIYGLQKAATMHPPPQKRGFFIQANTFTQQKNAYQYQHQLQSKTKYAVRVLKKTLNHHYFYDVIVGPIPSAHELKKTATTLLYKPTITHASPPKKPMHPMVNHQNKTKQNHTRTRSLPIPARKHHREKIQQLKRAPTPVKHQNTPTPHPVFTHLLPLHSEYPRMPSAHQSVPQKKTSNKIKRLDYRSMLSNGQWFVSGGVGAISSQGSGQMTVNNGSGFAAPYNLDIYSTKQNTNTVITLSGGYQWQENRQIIPAYSVGLMWQYALNNNLGKTITQYSDPAFLNYNYHWNINSNLLLANAKFNLFEYKRFSPYLDGGIGAVFHQGSGYSEQALAGVTPRVSPGFQQSNSNQIAYLVGIGFDYGLTRNISLSAGYNYINMGQLSSGQGVGTWSSQKLNLGSYHANEFLLSLNYLFDNNNVSH